MLEKIKNMKKRKEIIIVFYIILFSIYILLNIKSITFQNLFNIKKINFIIPIKTIFLLYFICFIFSKNHKLNKIINKVAIILLIISIISKLYFFYLVLTPSYTSSFTIILKNIISIIIYLYLIYNLWPSTKKTDTTNKFNKYIIVFYTIISIILTLFNLTDLTLINKTFRLINSLVLLLLDIIIIIRFSENKLNTK